MSTPNLFTNSAPAQSYTAVNSGMDGAQQTEGETLFQQASQSHQPEVLVKRQFEQRSQSQKSKLANEFIASAGREGLSQLAATPDGQHALAVVYDHAGSDGRGTMRQVHEEQGNTAVDYTGGQNNSPGSQSDDPLSVSDAGVEIGPRPNPLQYGAMTSGVVYGLVENTVEGIVQMGAVVGKESQDLKNVDNLEYAGMDEYCQESTEPGLSLPSLEDVGNALKGHFQATNEAVKTAKEKGEYFEAGRAMSDDPMLQMTGLGDSAVIGSLVRLGRVTKLNAQASGNVKINSNDLSVQGNKAFSFSGGNPRLADDAFSPDVVNQRSAEFYNFYGDNSSRGTLSNFEARQWYLAEDAQILNKIDTSAPLEIQARQAFELRNTNRTDARILMYDRVSADRLIREEPNVTWDQIVTYKQNQGLSGDDIYRSILQSSQKTRASINKAYGLD